VTTKSIITDIHYLTLSWEKKNERNKNNYENENENNFGDFKMYTKFNRQNSKLATIPFSIEKNKFVEVLKYENLLNKKEVTSILTAQCEKEVEEYRAASLQLTRYYICTHIYRYIHIYMHEHACIYICIHAYM
jgi:hypothetical protein